jgi:hypothetical protein
LTRPGRGDFCRGSRRDAWVGNQSLIAIGRNSFLPGSWT